MTAVKFCTAAVALASYSRRFYQINGLQSQRDRFSERTWLLVWYRWCKFFEL